MRPVATVSCSGCGRPWPARTSRFCGRCGDALPAGPDGPGRRDRSGRRLADASVGLAAVALLALTGMGLHAAISFASRPGPEVALPPASGLTAQPGLSGDDARAALAPFDPDRLRCEPVGCERWQLDLPGGADYVAHVGDLLVFQREGRLIAIDAHRGEQRWSVPLDGSDDGGRNEHRMMASTDDVLVIARETGDLRAIGQDGRERWRAPPPAPSWIWSLQVVDDVVLTVGPPTSAAEGSMALHAYGLAGGAPRWSTVVRHLHEGVGVLVETTEGRLVRLDPSTGAATATFPDASWANPTGEHLVVLGDDHERSWVADAATGRRLLELDGYVEASLVEGDSVYLQIAQPDRRVGRELIALDLDGAERWRRQLPLDLTAACCPALALDEDGALYVHDPETPGRFLDPSTGDDLPGRDPAPIPDGEWWTGHVTVRHGPSGALVVTGAAGSARIPSGQAWLLHDDPVVLANSDGLIGVDLLPAPGRPAPGD